MNETRRSYRDSHQSEEYGKNYQKHYSGDNYNTRVWELEKRAIKKLIDKYFKSKQNVQYLDFACGTGRVCSFLENEVEKCIGLDVSESMMKIAKEKCQKTEFINCDITKEKCLEGKQFDLITAFRFFLNAEDELRRSALKSLRPLLKKDGLFIFNIHGNKRSFRHLQVMFSGRGNEISPNEIKKLFQYYGFSIKEIIGVSFLYEKLSFLPASIWFAIETFLQKIPFINILAIDFIAVAEINEKTQK